MLTTLLTHLEWADTLVWNALLRLRDAHEDRRARELLYHLHSVQWAYLQVWRSEPLRIPEFGTLADLNALAAWVRPYYPQVQTFARSLDDTALGRVLDLPWKSQIVERFGTAADATLAEMIFQVISHTTYHRGQIATRIRELGGEPPLTDFIAWIWMGRPRTPDFGAAQ